MKIEDIIYALKMVVWYNGYDETIKDWIKLEPGEYGIICPLGSDTGSRTAQLQVLWMICVVLFGGLRHIAEIRVDTQGRGFQGVFGRPD